MAKRKRHLTKAHKAAISRALRGKKRKHKGRKR